MRPPPQGSSSPAQMTVAGSLSPGGQVVAVTDLSVVVAGLAVAAASGMARWGDVLAAAQVTSCASLGSRGRGAAVQTASAAP